MLRVCQLRNTTTDAHFNKEEIGTAKFLLGEEKAGGEVFDEGVKEELEAVDYLLPTPLSPYGMADGTNDRALPVPRADPASTVPTGTPPIEPQPPAA